MSETWNLGCVWSVFQLINNWRLECISLFHMNTLYMNCKKCSRFFFVELYLILHTFKNYDRDCVDFRVIIKESTVILDACKERT